MTQDENSPKDALSSWFSLMYIWKSQLFIQSLISLGIKGGKFLKKLWCCVGESIAS